MILATAGMTASAGSVMLSRCGGETASKASPTIEGKATVGVATLFTSDELTPLAGNEITTLRVGIVSKLKLDGVKVWVASAPGETPLRCIEIAKADLKSGWNEATLAEPLLITGDQLYIGYTFTQPSKCNVISVIPSENPGILMLNDGNGWTDISASCPGELSVEAVVEGENLASHDITLSAVTPEYPVAETGTDAYLRLDFVNTGLDPLSSLSYEISHISGRAEGTAAFEPVEPRGKGSVFLTLPLAGSCEASPATVNVTAANGNPLASPRSRQAMIAVADAPYLQRNVLLEEFSNEFCNNCPAASDKIHAVLASMPEAFRVALAVHHAGSAYDYFTVEASKEYESFYSGKRYSPMVMADRTPFSGCVDLAPSTEEQIRSRIEAAMNQPAGASLSFRPAIDPVNGLIEIEACGTAATDGDMALTLFLTEDNVAAIMQAGAGKDYIHHNMLRATGAAWGEAVAIGPDRSFSLKAQLAFDTAWKNGDCRLTAFLTDADPESPSYRRVLQCFSLPLPYARQATITAGIGAPATGDEAVAISAEAGNISISGDYSSAEVFTINGRPAGLRALVPGIYIVRVTTGSGATVTRKITI